MSQFLDAFFQILEAFLALIGAATLLGAVLIAHILHRDEEEWEHLQRDRVVDLKKGADRY